MIRNSGYCDLPFSQFDLLQLDAGLFFRSFEVLLSPLLVFVEEQLVAIDSPRAFPEMAVDVFFEVARILYCNKIIKIAISESRFLLLVLLQI